MPSSLFCMLLFASRNIWRSEIYESGIGVSDWGRKRSYSHYLSRISLPPPPPSLSLSLGVISVLFPASHFYSVLRPYGREGRERDWSCSPDNPASFHIAVVYPLVHLPLRNDAEHHMFAIAFRYVLVCGCLHAH